MARLLKTRIKAGTLIEASGGISESNVAQYCDPAIDIISMSCLVQGCQPVDFSMRISCLIRKEAD